MPDTPPSISSSRYLSLDVWRGLACLMVVLDHSAFVLRFSVDHDATGMGWLERVARNAFSMVSDLAWGPPLFFVMSGYCMASSLESLRRKGQSPWQFLAKRMWRTFPPYWAAILIFAGVVLLFDLMQCTSLYQTGVSLELFKANQLSTSQWIGNLTLTETWRPLVTHTGDPMVFTRVAWSLCYQEQFYLACFVLLLLNPRNLNRSLAWFTAAVVAYRIFCWDSGRIDSITGALPYFWHEFAVGLLVFRRLNQSQSFNERRILEGCLLALGMIGWYCDFYSTMVAAGFGLTMIAARPLDGWLATRASLKPMQACGRRCYSIYLIHLPACTILSGALFLTGWNTFWTVALVVVPLAMLGGIVSGFLFHDIFERPFLALPELRTVRLIQRKPQRLMLSKS